MALFLGVMHHLGPFRFGISCWSPRYRISSLLEQPVRQSIRHLVPREFAQRRYALSNGLQRSMLFGPSIGGLLIPVIDTKGCFFLATAGNLLVLVTIFLIRIPAAEPPAGKTSITRDMIEGLRLAWNTPVFLALLTVLAVVSFCTKPYTQFMPVFAQTILNMAPRSRHVAHGAWRWRDLGRADARFGTHFEAGAFALGLAGGFGTSRPVRRLAQLSLVAGILVRRRLSNHIPIVGRHAATIPHQRAQPRSHHVDVWSDQSRPRPNGQLPLRTDRDLDRRPLDCGDLRRAHHQPGRICGQLPCKFT
jgi:hypothetical protein